MAATGTTIHSRDLENPIGMGRFASLISGLLLLAAVGCEGKFIEQSIAAYTKAHHVTFPNIEYVFGP